MINMATNKEDAANFITNVSVNDDNTKFILTYGDGHIEYSDYVTDHNYNYYLNRLEQQFLNYKNNYIDFLSKIYTEVITKRFIGSISALLGLFLSYNIDIHIVMKIIIWILIIIFGLGYRFMQQIKLMALDNEFDSVKLMEYLQVHKEEFYGKILDENTGNIKEAQIINFNNIDLFTSPEGMKAMFDLININEESSQLKK
ncbi:MAG: hypothetical protein ACI4WW_04435 [Candidatus Coprovivens sp.]